MIFNFASRSRPDKFFAALRNIDSVCSGNYTVIAKLDLDDPAGVEAYAEVVNFPNVIVKWGYSKSKIHAINRDLDDLPDYDIICNHSDDMVLGTPIDTIAGRIFLGHFDEILRQYMRLLLKFDGVLHLPDGQIKNELCTYSIMGRTYFDRFGYVYHPDYTSLWCDNEFMDVAQKLGKWAYLPIQMIEHKHPAWGKAEKDAQYIEQGALYWQDKEVYERRKGLNFGL